MSKFLSCLLLCFIVVLCSFSAFSEAYKLNPQCSDNVQHLRINKLYNDKKPENTAYQQAPLIPKIIHQIWVGDRPMPEIYVRYMETWKKHHPKWEHKLWTDKDVENWEGEFILKDLYERAYTAQEKADILRLNVVYRYGGLYVDTDFECLKSFNELHHKYEFYAGEESCGGVPISIFGAKPKHPLFDKIFANIRTRWQTVEEEFFLKNTSVNKAYDLKSISVTRCQGSFGDAVYEANESTPTLLVLPEDILNYTMKRQIIFCVKQKLLKLFPSLSKISDDMHTISIMMSAQRWGEIRDTTVYNGIDQKISIKENNHSLSRRMRSWIHNNIDVYFIGCS